MIDKKSFIPRDDVIRVLDEMLEITITTIDSYVADDKELTNDKIRRLFVERNLLNKLRNTFKEE